MKNQLLEEISITKNNISRSGELFRSVNIKGYVYQESDSYLDAEIKIYQYGLDFGQEYFNSHNVRFYKNERDRIVPVIMNEKVVNDYKMNILKSYFKGIHKSSGVIINLQGVKGKNELFLAVINTILWLKAYESRKIFGNGND